MDTKPPWASVTLWGAVFLIVAMLLNTFFGIEITVEEQASLTEKVSGAADSITWVIGMLMVIWGRFKAVKKVTLTGG